MSCEYVTRSLAHRTVLLYILPIIQFERETDYFLVNLPQ